MSTQRMDRPATEAASPARPPFLGRLLGLDAARGVALLAIMVVHVLPSRDAEGNTTFGHLVTSGRSAAAFVVFAGISLALVTGGSRPHTGPRLAADRVGTLVRALAIGLVGLLLGYPNSGAAVILPYFTVLFLLALPLLGLRARAAALLAVAVAVVVPLLSALLRDGLPDKTLGNHTLDDLFTEPFRVLSTLTFTGYYPALPWLAYLCAGLAVGRLALTSTRVRVGLLVGGAALAVAAASATQLLLGPLGGLDRLSASAGLPPAATKEALERTMAGTVPTDTWWWQAVDAPYSSTMFELLGGIGTSFALLGACLLLERLLRVALVPLAAAGSMTLTIYTVHLLAQSTDWVPADPEASWALQAAGALVLGTAWRLWVGRGPLEAGIAVLTKRVQGAVGARSTGP